MKKRAPATERTPLLSLPPVDEHFEDDSFRLLQRRSFWVMVAIPPAMGFLAFQGVTAWEYWALAAGGAALLLVGPIPRPRRWRRKWPAFEVTESGLIFDRPGRPRDDVPWSAIDWIAMREVFPLFSLRLEPSQLSITLCTSGTTTELRFPAVSTMDLAVFLWKLNEQQARQRLPDARQQLAAGAVLDFGAVRLSQTEIYIRRRSQWITLSLAPWRTADEVPSEMRAFTPSGSFRDPELFVQLARLMLPPGRIETDRTSWGGIRRLKVAVGPK